MAYEITQGMLDNFIVESIEIQPGISSYDKMDFKIVLIHINSNVNINILVTITKYNKMISRSTCDNDHSISDYARKTLRKIGENIVDKIIEKYNGIYN